MYKVHLNILGIMAVCTLLLTSCKKSNDIPAVTPTAQVTGSGLSSNKLSIDTGIKLPVIRSITTPKGVYNVADFGRFPTDPLNPKGVYYVLYPETGNLNIKVNDKLFAFSIVNGDQITAFYRYSFYVPGYTQLTIFAVNRQENAQVSILVSYLAPGIYLVKEVIFEFDGVGLGGIPTAVTYTSMNYNGGGFINLKSLNLGPTIYVSTYGTFDAIIGFRSGIWGGPDQMRISGGFNIAVPRLF